MGLEGSSCGWFGSVSPASFVAEWVVAVFLINTAQRLINKELDMDKPNPSKFRPKIRCILLHYTLYYHDSSMCIVYQALSQRHL